MFIKCGSGISSSLPRTLRILQCACSAHVVVLVPCVCVCIWQEIDKPSPSLFMHGFEETWYTPSLYQVLLHSLQEGLIPYILRDQLQPLYLELGQYLQRFILCEQLQPTIAAVVLGAWSVFAMVLTRHSFHIVVEETKLENQIKIMNYEFPVIVGFNL